VQVALGRDDLRVPHGVLDGDRVELADHETAEGMAQVVERSGRRPAVAIRTQWACAARASPPGIRTSLHCQRRGPGV
jgi:hypothetical protein